MDAARTHGCFNRRRRGNAGTWLAAGALVVSAVLALGCGSRGTDTGGAAVLPTGNTTRPTSAATAASAGEATAAARSDAAPGQGDVQGLLQAVLDTPQLQQYFHADKPGRTPLTVVLSATTLLDPPPALVKFGAPVRWMTRADAEQGKGPYLELTTIERRDVSATVELRYRVEGVHGKVTLEKTAAGWVVKSAQIAES